MEPTSELKENALTDPTSELKKKVMEWLSQIDQSASDPADASPPPIPKRNPLRLLKA